MPQAVKVFYINCIAIIYLKAFIQKNWRKLFNMRLYNLKMPFIIFVKLIFETEITIKTNVRI